MTMELLQYQKKYAVHVYETGPDGKLTLYSLFDYFQDIASDHAVKLGYGRDDLLKQNHFWVLSRIYAEISAWPQWGEELVIKTWPRGTESLFALRDYEARYSDGRPVANATSSWLIIDRDTRRIQRPDKTLSMFDAGLIREKALSRNAMKLDPLTGGFKSKALLNVRVSDLDLNLHTNNARYLKWVVDSYDLDFMLNYVPLSAEINYLAESHYNDTISIMVSENNDNGNVFSHSILRTSDNAELCRLKISWARNHV